MSVERSLRYLEYLEIDHGTGFYYSPLPHHPLFEEFALEQGDVIVEFADCRYILYQRGGMSPIPGGGSPCP